MAIDGPGFFAGDQDFDALSELAVMAGFDTMQADEDGKEERVKALNDGKFTEVFDKLYRDYQDSKSSRQPWWAKEGAERDLVLFCLAAMEHGALIQKKQVYLLRCLARKLPTVYQQMLVIAATDEYKNDGTPWILESHVPYPHVQTNGGQWDADFQDPFVCLSGPGHSADEPNYPHAHTRTCLRCGKHDPKVTCEKCEIARYCDEHCQRADFKLHKGSCGR